MIYTLLLPVRLKFGEGESKDRVTDFIAKFSFINQRRYYGKSYDKVSDRRAPCKEGRN
jgi:hypothetical protein